MIVLYVLLGVFIGAVAAYVLMDKRLDAVAAESGKKDIALAGCREQLNGATSRAQHLEASAVELNAKIQEKEEENKEIAERASSLNAQVATLQRELDLVKLQRDEEENRHREELHKQEEAMNQYKEEMSQRDEKFENMARKVLEENTKKLEEENKKAMAGVTNPLKDTVSERLKELDNSLKKIMEDSVKRTTSVSEQIKQMMETAVQISEQTSNLTDAMTGRKNKIIGTMGEIILETLLKDQELTEGIHYEVQARLRNEQGRPLKHEETGKELQPDVILHYPQGQDVIIDSKVSLVAYEKHVKAETPEEKERYLQEHINSVRRHVKELANKNYSEYIKNGREAVDFVIMFMPFESSLQLALVNDPTLWRDAFNQKVFITGGQSLTAILHMIHLAWVQNQQAENQKKVFGVANELLERVGDFMHRYNKLGEALLQTQKAYDEAEKKIYTGRQSVTQKAHELVELGVKQSQKLERRIPKAREEWLLEQKSEESTTETEES